ncbi:MAG TPA: SURF1 family cytochrome oxidase biogenesis protein [Candidatus Lumbricidophila sp.]|nr:SURF1 family cytochrome oxidase biogenesis protein [Candidatus Lumbricidophila sp.]
MLQMMLRPRWVLALIGALALAAAFAALAQWQIGRAAEEAKVRTQPTETIRPFAGIADPGAPTQQSSTGQLVTVHGSYVPGDTVVIGNRLQGDRTGFWVVAHLEVTDAPAGGIPIALGWAPDRAAAEAARDAFERQRRLSDSIGSAVTGRFLPSESPGDPAKHGDAYEPTTLAVAQLVNLWRAYDGKPAYFAYITDREAPAGLEAIHSPPPETQAEINWLNVFYAIEWIAFAGFAVFFWFRLVRDAVEREAQEQLEAAGETP